MANYTDNLKTNKRAHPVALTSDIEDMLRKCTTRSEQIRNLHALSFDYRQIKDVLGLNSYQHAYNVINNPPKKRQS